MKEFNKELWIKAADNVGAYRLPAEATLAEIHNPSGVAIQDYKRVKDEYDKLINELNK